MRTTQIILTVSILFLSGCTLVSSSSDGGVFRSDDGGKIFSQKATIDEKTKIGSVDVLSMVVNPQNGSEVYIGTKSNGMFKTTDAGEKWVPVKISDVSVSKVYSLSIDPVNSAIVFAAAVVGDRGKIMKSKDSGATWKEVYSEPTGGMFVTVLGTDSFGSGKIYAGTSTGQIILSGNGGDSWSNIYQGQGAILKIAEDAADSNVAYFLVNQGGLLRTKDGGSNFENLGSGNFFSVGTSLGMTTDVLADPSKSGWVWAGATSGLFLSKDGGDNWNLVKVLNSPKENAIRGIAVNPQNSDEIIYGASQVFYKSIDGGQSWATTQFGGGKTIEKTFFNEQNPGVIYVGMNKR
jgi:photosystem II stability/assembly factor-like uncharacterized protein